MIPGSSASCLRNSSVSFANLALASANNCSANSWAVGETVRNFNLFNASSAFATYFVSRSTISCWRAKSLIESCSFLTAAAAAWVFAAAVRWAAMYASSWAWAASNTFWVPSGAVTVNFVLIVSDTGLSDLSSILSLKLTSAFSEPIKSTVASLFSE